MLNYHVKLALRSFRRNKALTILMVLAISLGIGTAMTTLTVFYVLSGDPIPQKSNRLFYVQVDPRSAEGYKSGAEPPRTMTRFDAETLLRDSFATKQAMMASFNGVIYDAAGSISPFITAGRRTTAGFFSLFDVPFQYGRAWNAQDDNSHAQVVVISKDINDKLFNGINSIGKPILIEGKELRVIGVIDTWAPNPKFYDLGSRKFGGHEQLFVPFSTSLDIGLSHDGSMSCFGRDGAPEDPLALNAPCAWVQYWVELDNSEAIAKYRSYLENYSTEQRKAGRFERPTNIRLRNVVEWLDYNKAVPSDVRLQMWLAFGFLIVCIFNTTGLLLAKFLSRSGELAVRRALGATRKDILAQCLIESGSVGLVGGIVGLGFAQFGLWAVRQRPAEYASLAYIDIKMLMLAFVLAVISSLLAGAFPAWRATKVMPAAHLKF